MRHGVIVREILTEALKETVRVAISEAYSVIGSSIVDETIDATMLSLDVFNSATALQRIFEVCLDKVAMASWLHLREKVQDALRGPTDDNNVRAFVDAGTRDGFSDAGTTSGHNDDTIFEAEVHRVSVALNYRRLKKPPSIG